MKIFFRLCVFVSLFAISLPAAADLFSAQDGSFTLDMPTGWSRSKNPPQRSVLSVQKGDARIDIKTIDCTTEACLDRMINNDVVDVKAKQMTVIKNTYTGEEIKRLEFPTGEPFYYISFYSPKNDFSAGYFLIDGKGYSALSKNLTYGETDLIFAAISPTTVTQTFTDDPSTPGQAQEVDIFQAYSTEVLPDVEVENLEDISSPVTAQSDTLSPAPVSNPSIFSRSWHTFKTHFNRLPIHTLVRPEMPPFIRHLGHLFDGLIALMFLFLLAWCGAGIVRLFVRPIRMDIPVNPNSFYPIKLERRYGTPSLIYRAKDNQGNILTALCVRWDALFMFFGIVIMLLALIVMAITSLCQQLHILQASAFVFNTIYSIASLALPLGFVILFCGIVWGQLAMSEITLFDRKGKKAAVILQKGYSLFYERYQIYFARSKTLLLAERKRFVLRRQWTLLSKDRIEFASFRERSALRAIGRMLCGHLWGMLRADYDITGIMESSGSLQNTHALFNKLICHLDKPEAVNARDILAISLLISIRDRDKWYPWFN